MNPGIVKLLESTGKAGGLLFINYAWRPLKVLVDGILKGMDIQLEAAYSKEGRPSNYRSDC